MRDDILDEPIESVAESFPVKLEAFEGPLDLLLYLIRAEQIDIYDIPIARITRQYLNYLDMMKALNLEIAGEYLLMAATLIRIKARLLVPRHGPEEEEEDPREGLILALLEYKRFKDAAEKMLHMELTERQILKREDFSYLQPEIVETFAIEATVYDLVRAFYDIMRQASDQPVHEVDNFELTIEDQIEYVMQALQGLQSITLTTLVAAEQNRLYYVVTFLAILELVKLQRISIRQQVTFGEIYVIRI